MSEQEPTQISVPIEWYFPNGLRSEYATNLIVQHTEHEFIVSFFELVPPPLLTEEDRANLESVRAVCVARIVIAGERMKEFIQVFQENWERYQARIKKGKA